jgi:hypothetical protein
MARAAEIVDLWDSVANILEIQLPQVIEDWLGRVQQCPELVCIPLNFEERTGLCGGCERRAPRSNGRWIA